MNFSVWVGGSSVDVAELPTATIQQYRANAHTTACLALGHNKSDRGHALVKGYDRELASRNANPDTSIEGIFNGKGST